MNRPAHGARSFRLSRWMLPLLACSALLAPAWAVQPERAERTDRTDRADRTRDRQPEGPRRVIFILADGMGVAMLSSVDLLREADAPLAIESMPVTGLIKTSSRTGPVTDSAASASAYATGHRVRNGSLSITPQGTPLTTVLEAARDAGLATGIITTTDLTDASPAAFASHVPSRRLHAEIFKEIIDTRPDLIVGGIGKASIQELGLDKDDLPEGTRPKAPAFIERAASAGYRVLDSDEAILDELASDAGTPVLALADPRANFDDNYGPPLADTLERALATLARDPEGFFLFVEQEETDSGGHANDLARVIAGVEEVDAALRVALAFQREHPGTLIVLTADHDTGGLSLDSGDYESGRADTLWLSGNHTTHWVPIYAKGPGAGRFTGVHENRAVARLLARGLGLDWTPQRVEASEWVVPERRGIGR
ncbi:MAG: alkaline phosphatase [Phycisphaerales bacterium JB037]